MNRDLWLWMLISLALAIGGGALVGAKQWSDWMLVVVWIIAMIPALIAITMER